MKRISLEQVINGERFFRVPKVLFELDFYKKMSSDSKLLYAILKDRFDLSLKNNWIDDDGNIYFIFTVAEIGEMLGCGKDKVIKLKRELKKYDLLEEVRQGLNKPNLIYLGALHAEKGSSPLSTAEFGKSDFQNSEKTTSRILKSRLQEVGKPESNDTDISETNYSDYISSRRTEKNSDEFSQSAETNQSLSQNQSTPFVEQKYYSLLQVIADKYNEQMFGFPDVLTMTHNQKMKIGQYLASGYVTSAEVLNMIERIPKDSTSPLAYLLKSLENLKQERLYEQKSIAHLNAENYYSMKKGGDENV